MLSQDLPLDSNGSNKWVLSSLGLTGSVKVMTGEQLVREEDEGVQISDFLKLFDVLLYFIHAVVQGPDSVQAAIL